jgi:hypothetical protein
LEALFKGGQGSTSGCCAIEEEEEEETNMQVSDASSAIDDASLEEVGRLPTLVNSETSLCAGFYAVWSVSEDCGVFSISTNMSEKWSSRCTLHFLEEYGKHPCLWNPENQEYKNKQPGMPLCRKL